MKMDFQLEGGLMQTLEVLAARAEDLAKPCAKWGGYKRKQVKELISSGEGMPPLAESTLEKRRRTRTGRITKHGEIRASAARRLDARGKRISGLLKHYEAKYFGLGKFLIPKDVQAKIERLQAQRASINRAIRKAQDTAVADRRSGKTVLEKKGDKRFPKLAQTIRMKVIAKGTSGTVIVRCSAGVIGKVQNEGGAVGNGAEVPETDFLVLTGADIEVFKRILIEHGVAVFQEGT